ncbi:FtsX-like permease family protein [Streptomyces roseicoloratus]|uniref:FtsX-like permease family protein n=1 Tax=Streptomyces roseicoloratus TaxID=2508722 RepID=UPI00403DCC01
MAAPALALLAGTVLTLRLLPPAARLAERRAAGGRGLATALAGWQFSRRPLRGAGPVLLLVLAVAMGMLAIGQRDTWERSQRDQADFRAGAAVRVLSTGTSDLGATEHLAAVPGVRDAAPVHRAEADLGDLDATVLAMDTRRVGDGMLLRADLADGPVAERLTAIQPKSTGSRPGVALPEGARSLTLDLRSTAPPETLPAKVTVVLTDAYGVPYRKALDSVPPDGRTHRITVTLPDRSGTGVTLTGIEAVSDAGTAGSHELAVAAIGATGADGSWKAIDTRGTLASWAGELTLRSSDGESTAAVPAGPPAAGVLHTVPFAIAAPGEGPGYAAYTLALSAPGGTRPRTIPAIVTDAFLAATQAKKGDTVDVTVGSHPLTVTIADVLRELPTTGPGARAVSTGPAEAAPKEGGAVLVDLHAANLALGGPEGTVLTPTEWWLTPEPGRTAEVARTLRARPDADPALVLVRDEAAAELLGDPLGAGPNAALMAVAAAAAALAAVGFAVSSAGSLRERSREFGVLRALGAPRRRLAQLLAAEQGLLVGIGLLVGVALGTVLTRAVVPLIVLTGQAERPVPAVLVELPLAHVSALLAAVAALPLVIVAVIALRRTDPAATLRTQGEQ